MKVRGLFLFCMSIYISALSFSAPSFAASQTGIASVYGHGDGYAWRKTASGARMNPQCHDCGPQDTALWYSGDRRQ